MGATHWKGFSRGSKWLRWGGKSLRMNSNCRKMGNKGYCEDPQTVRLGPSRGKEGISEDMKKKEKENKLTEKYSYVLVLYIVVPYEAATQKVKSVA